MTLLESVVALVILGLAAVGFLELFQRVSVATRDTAGWSRAVAVAELSMERAVLRAEAANDSISGMRRRIEIRPFGAGLREVIVTIDVPPPSGAQVVLHRLVPAQ